MPPIKSKRCCVPHCPNTEGTDTKIQFFRIGANLATRNKLRIGKLVNPDTAILHCCEEHFDLPNDALNYIRYKYQPGTKLKLRTGMFPHKKLPVNVCRLCLNLIYNKDDKVDISMAKNREIVAALLPAIDLSITLDPVACSKCFNPLKQYYEINKNALKNEMVVVNCVKSAMERSPKRFVSTSKIDLFDEYNDIKELLKENTDDLVQTEAKENVEQPGTNVEENAEKPKPVEENVEQPKNNSVGQEELEKKEDKYSPIEHTNMPNEKYASIANSDNINT